jgi:hypothetical protein
MPCGFTDSAASSIIESAPASSVQIACRLEPNEILVTPAYS